ncbi:MAG: hypothetical protein VYA30_01990 [Myxococcota bacterium]|nr:hypothetical protein [Myxococcota bacterium]
MELNLLLYLQRLGDRAGPQLTHTTVQHQFAGEAHSLALLSNRVLRLIAAVLLFFSCAWSIAEGETRGRVPPAAPELNTMPPKAQKLKLTWYFELTPRYFVGRNDINQGFVDPQTNTLDRRHFLSPSIDTEYGSVYIATEQTLAYALGHQTGQINLMLDTGEIYRHTASELNPNTEQVTSRSEWQTNGQSLADEFHSTYFVRKLAVTHSLDKDRHVSFTVGKGNPIVGNGLVYNDYSPLASVAFDSQKKWAHGVRLEGMIVSVTNDIQPTATTISQVQLTFRTPSAGIWHLMGAYFNDQNQNLANVFKQWLTTAAAVTARSRSALYAGRPGLFDRTVELRSAGHVNWVGGGYDQSWPSGHRLWLNIYLSRGSGNVTLDATRFNRILRRTSRRLNQQQELDQRFFSLDLAGWAFQGGADIYLVRDWYLSPFCVGISGDDGLDVFLESSADSRARKTFRGFLGVVPYLDQTNIFFNGGLGHHFSSRTMSLSGLAGRGVLAAGFSASGSLWRDLSYQGGPAFLRAMHKGPLASGKNYGLEINQSLTYSLRPELTLSLQYDLLRTGDFFIENAWNSQTTVQMSYAPTNGH